MQISKIGNTPSFEARIKINKPKIKNDMLKSAGETSVTGGATTISVGASSGADMTVHNMGSAVSAMQHSSSLFDQFSEYGHKALKLLTKINYEHNGYDASFFSSSMSTGGALNYYHGMNNIVKAIDKEYSKKIPT